jgi:hypothetical protein
MKPYRDSGRVSSQVFGRLKKFIQEIPISDEVESLTDELNIKIRREYLKYVV